MSTSETRECFERFFSDSRRNRGAKHPPSFDRRDDGTYADDHTQRHWWTWQQALAAQERAEPEYVVVSGHQLAAALEFVAPDQDEDQMESCVRIGIVALTNDAGEKESPTLACCLDDYPEEGWIALPEEPAHPPAAQPAQADHFPDAGNMVAQPVAVPDGYALVPVEPTPEMTGILQWFERGSPAQISVGWLKVLAAAPAAPKREPLTADDIREPKNGDAWRVHWWNESARLMLPSSSILDSFNAFKNGTLIFTIKRRPEPDGITKES